MFHQFNKRWLPFLIYAVLAAAVLGALLRSGYILTLDMVFVPQAKSTAELWGLEGGWTWLSPAAPLHFLIQAASHIMPEWLIQKLILFFILFLAGLGAHRLVPSGRTGAYFAGILYMINPFTYTRFLAGQWVVLWAYAFLPFAIAAFIRLLQQGGKRNAIQVALLSTLVGLVHIAGLFLLFLAFLIILVVRLIAERKRLSKITATAKYIGMSAGMFLMLNLYWLAPILTAKGTIVSQIGQADLLVFAPKPSSILGVMFDTASMYGFWRGGYVYAKDFIPFWWVLFLFILFLVIYGFLSKVADEKQGWIVLSLGVVGVVSFLLAVGAASDITRPPFEWLWEHVFILRGFRDSQKFVALLCIVYAYLGGLGVSEFANELRQQKKRLPRTGVTTLVALALLVPLAYSFTMFGFHGQLGTTDYPKEWYEVNQYLNEDEDDFNVLFLPWHQYMDYSWLPNQQKRLRSPAQQFFDKPVVHGDNIEMPGIYSQSTNPISKYVEFLLRNRGDVENLGELLAPLNVKYVILVNEADYKSYGFLYRQEDLRVELERPGLTLFKIEHPVAKVYGVDTVVYIKSLEEYLELSQTQDVMKHLYLLGEGMSSDYNGGMHKLAFTERSPVKYEVAETSHRYTIFTVPQNVSTDHWEYNGHKPLKHLGFMPAFTSSPDGGEVIYTRFYYVYLPSYIISVLAVGFMVYYYFRRSK